MRKKHVVHVPKGPPEHPFLSPAIRAGDYIYVSGNVGLLPGKPAHGEKGKNWMPGELIAGGIVPQTRQTIENLRIVLEAAGASLDDVIKVNTFLRDIDRDFHAYNDVYHEYFKVEPPARTTVEAKILNNILVEIECVAYKPRD
jgi:2-iminobutanoate/2-iminopropanoate deaminase